MIENLLFWNCLNGFDQIESNPLRLVSCDPSSGHHLTSWPSQNQDHERTWLCTDMTVTYNYTWVRGEKNYGIIWEFFPNGGPLGIREAPLNLASPLFGHCPNSDYTPPPHSNGRSGALFFRADLSKFAKSPFWRYISAQSILASLNTLLNTSKCPF